MGYDAIKIIKEAVYPCVQFFHERYTSVRIEKDKIHEAIAEIQKEKDFTVGHIASCFDDAIRILNGHAEAIAAENVKESKAAKKPVKADKKPLKKK